MQTEVHKEVRGGRGAIAVASVALLALLTGCNDQSSPGGPTRAASEPEDWRPRAQEVAQSRVRAGVNDPAAGLRGVQSFVQADPKSVAVCGQVNTVRGGSAERYVPFVVLVNDTGNGPDRYRSEQHVSMNSADATRVYVLGLTHCRAEGGQPTGTRAAAPPLLPPIPQDLPHAGRPVTVVAAAEPTPTLVSASPAQTRPPGAPYADPAVTAAVSRTGAGGNATLRSAGNLRVSPAGGGDVMRVVPGGTTLHVYGTAPGGWYQVGSGQPEGWVHGSLLDIRG